MKNRILEYLPE